MIVSFCREMGIEKYCGKGPTETQDRELYHPGTGSSEI